MLEKLKNAYLALCQFLKANISPPIEETEISVAYYDENEQLFRKKLITTGSYRVIQ